MFMYVFGSIVMWNYQHYTGKYSHMYDSSDYKVAYILLMQQLHCKYTHSQVHGDSIFPCVVCIPFIVNTSQIKLMDIL